jgi:hypothetical protein
MKTCAERMEGRWALVSRKNGWKITIIRRSDLMILRILPGNSGEQFEPIIERLYHEKHRGGCRWRIKLGVVDNSVNERREQCLRLRYLDCLQP